MRLRYPKAQEYGTNLTLITMVDSLRLRWAMCRLTVLDFILHLTFLSYVLVTWRVTRQVTRVQSLVISPALSVSSKVLDAVFPHKTSLLWFGCHSFVRVRSMSVAPGYLPPPTLVLLNELCGSPALARSRASSSRLYWPAYNSLRLISACSVSQQLDWTLPRTYFWRKKKPFYILICL